LEDGVNPFWSTCIGEKTTTLGKASVVLLGTYGGELEYNRLGTEKVKKFNNNTRPPHKTKSWVF
jgi:hypothetical protein